ncbi:MAG: hemerythrin family protein [Defluviitaleaceae bacterium]|nr:hemerythrin family protein [Defluviitaleaceae bacterium]MCL2274770.1 hemerythrin family protein [Defluviitaleaceae bacterium]
MLWSDKYLTGNRAIDDDHKRIFDLVRDIIDQNFLDRGEKITKVINFLGDYTIQHFRREEKLMEECEYPEYPLHKSQHDDFLEQIKELTEKTNGIDGKSLSLSLEVNDVIVKWLVEHVLGSDKQMAAYVREHSKIA